MDGLHYEKLRIEISYWHTTYMIIFTDSSFERRGCYRKAGRSRLNESETDIASCAVLVGDLYHHLKTKTPRIFDVLSHHHLEELFGDSYVARCDIHLIQWKVHIKSSEVCKSVLL